MLLDKFTNILVLAAHTDDAELGCGGTIARLKEAGAKVTFAVFSICEASVSEGFPDDVLLYEQRNAASVLGVEGENLIVYRFPVRLFPKKRQEILENLVVLGRKLRPDLVFLPSQGDIHQDHKVLHEEGIRAFKSISVLGYELPWNSLKPFHPTVFVPISSEHLKLKSNALEKYTSQRGKNYFHPDVISAIARFRGTQISVEFAEAYEVIRLIL